MGDILTSMLILPLVFLAGDLLISRLRWWLSSSSSLVFWCTI